MEAGGGSSTTAPHVLVLAESFDALAALGVNGAFQESVRITLASTEKAPEGVAGLPVRRLTPRSRGMTDWRAALAWTKTAVMARSAGITTQPLWAVKSDPWARAMARTEADVVISADRTTDRVLELVPDLVCDTVVVASAHAPAVWGGLRSLSLVLERLDPDRSPEPTSADDETPQKPHADLVEPDVVTMLAQLVDTAQAQRVPPVVLPTLHMARTIRWLNSTLGPQRAAGLVVEVLGDFPWERAPGAGAAGLAAQLAAMELSTTADESLLSTDTRFADASNAALAGADEALGRKDACLARARLSDAMALIFHRERHAERPHSPLVSDPEQYLRPLYANATFRELVTGGTRPRVKPRVQDEQGPRVLVLGGAYGDFHAPVVEALSEEIAVSFRRPKAINAFFGRKRIDPQLLDALAVLRGTGPAEPDDIWSVRTLNHDLRRALIPRLRRADVVFADWADRVTVWASHLVPEGCRLVIRIHSLDALDPFFHLVDWGSVDEVIVVSEPLRRLVSAMLTVAGAQVPVTVLPNLAALGEIDLPKEPDARTTLGMVGWSRRVKDPLWALELLAREPSWRLVLIGPDHPASSASARSYRQEVQRRLDDPALRDRIEIVGHTDDVPGHLRKIGVVLSTSRRESWHLGVVEGAASGAVPIVRNWPVFVPVGGARKVLPEAWVVETIDEAEARIRALTADPDTWDAARLQAQKEALALFDPASVAERYRQVVLADVVRPGGAGQSVPGA